HFTICSMHNTIRYHADVNECAKKSTCHEHSTCINTPGRYYCVCLPGFTGNGTFCTGNGVTNDSFVVTTGFTNISALPVNTANANGQSLVAGGFSVARTHTTPLDEDDE